MSCGTLASPEGINARNRQVGADSCLLQTSWGKPCLLPTDFRLACYCVTLMPNSGFRHDRKAASAMKLRDHSLPKLPRWQCYFTKVLSGQMCCCDCSTKQIWLQLSRSGGNCRNNICQALQGTLIWGVRLLAPVDMTWWSWSWVCYPCSSTLQLVKNKSIQIEFCLEGSLQCSVAQTFWWTGWWLHFLLPGSLGKKHIAD